MIDMKKEFNLIEKGEAKSKSKPLIPKCTCQYGINSGTQLNFFLEAVCKLCGGILIDSKDHVCSKCFLDSN